MIQDAIRINNIKVYYVKTKTPYTYHVALPDKTILAFTRDTKGAAYKEACDYAKSNTHFSTDPAKKQRNFGKWIYFKEMEIKNLMTYVPDIPNTKQIVNKLKKALNVLHNRIAT